MQVKKVIQLFFILICVIFPGISLAELPPTPPTSAIIPAPPTIAAKSYMLIDYLSDYVIAEQDVDQRVDPASLTKMMTVYVADQALSSKKIKLTDKVRVSENAWRASGSRMFLELNSEPAIADLLKGIIIQSGNDASVALAEHIAGSEATFAELMNFYAKHLGMVNTHFVNATGLPDPNHYTTARDMAVLAKALIRDFPETYRLYSQKEYTYQNIRQTNRNQLLWNNESVDGIKTGHTEIAGYCLVASGRKEGMRLISVLMGATTDALRVNETNKLLTYGFRFYETRKLYPAGTPVKQTRIWMGNQKEINLGLNEDLYVTIGRGQYDRLKTSINLDKAIKAPLQAGTVVGTLSVQIDDKIIVERPIVSLNAVTSANVFSRIYDSVSITVQSIWDKTDS